MPPFPLLCRLALEIRVWWWWLIGDTWHCECLESKVRPSLIGVFVAVQYLATIEISAETEHIQSRFIKFTDY